MRFLFITVSCGACNFLCNVYRLQNVQYFLFDKIFCI